MARDLATAATLDLEALRVHFGGEILRPGDPNYEARRKIWNGMVDKNPALIAGCQNVQDVVAAVNFARERKLLVAVRCGGHNVAGYGVCEGGIVIDLAPMRGVRVDPESRRAWAQGGCLLAEVDRATQEYGLAVPAGVVSHTGLGGLALGGGIGWLCRTYGLTIDNILAAQVVMADGQILQVSPSENAELFWGLRGGGGNFGIVTEFELKLHPVGSVLFGNVMYSLSEAKAVLQHYREFVQTEADEMHAVVGLRLAPPLPFVPLHVVGTPVITLGIFWAGDHPEGRQAMQPLLEFGQPIAAGCDTLPYVALQQALDAANPHGLQYYNKMGYLGDLPDSAIDYLIEAAKAITSPFTTIELGWLRGAVARVAEEETAFTGRQAAYVLNFAAGWPDPAANQPTIEWVRQSWTTLQEFMTAGVYVNFMTEEGQERVKAAYGPAKYARLVALKNRYDRHNLFRLNQNIKPTTQV